MNRTLKFRAWDIESSEWVYSDPREHNDLYFQFEDDGSLALYMAVEDDFAQKREAHIMQFTGLNDKNGKEIYEGDLVTIKTHFNHIVPFDFTYVHEDEKGFAVYLVKWDERRCEFYLEYQSHSNTEPSSKRCNVYSSQEVIGNIHEQIK